MTKILIIEDNDDIRENVVEILMLAGYEVFEADNGKTGTELAIRNLPDLILCDIMMGDLDGYGVLHLLNKHAETKAIPFIFMTAKSERSDIRKGMELGADDYLTKPFDDTELLNAIETRLKKRQVQQEFYSGAIEKLSEIVAAKDGLNALNMALEERKIRFFKKGQVIYYEGDRAANIWILLDGKVKTAKMAEDGRELLTGIFDHDDFIGINILFSEGIYLDTATASEDSHLCNFPREQFEEFISLYPDVAEKFVKILSNQIRQQEEQLMQLAYQSVRKRISEAILRMYRQQGAVENLTASRIDLASMSGTAPETVSRTLSDFKEEGLIEKKGSTIKIIDLKRLEKVKN
ncbi:MAG: transcriptional regulator [Flavobacterium sp. BFFFF1]|uniref:response regulator n=1 Tax=unclassified Flavobacterium TaxID=196869 RepID=UPI000BD20793|nr:MULTISPECIES: response regulator [unclassified Flavobacterium]OYU81814.1 MAG: transcriptional regulator [Flavobacterium sp. BFFFF1]